MNMHDIDKRCVHGGGGGVCVCVWGGKFGVNV